MSDHHAELGERDTRIAATQPSRPESPTWWNHRGRKTSRRSTGSHQCAANRDRSGRNVASRNKVESKKATLSKNPPSAYRWISDASAPKGLSVGAQPVAMVERSS